MLIIDAIKEEKEATLLTISLVVAVVDDEPLLYLPARGDAIWSEGIGALPERFPIASVPTMSNVISYPMLIHHCFFDLRHIF